MWLTFTLMMFLIGFGVASLITLRLTATTDLTGPVKTLITFAITLIFSSPFLLRGTSSSWNGTITNILTYITYFLFVCVFLFFCLMLARDILWLIGHWILPKLPSPFQAAAVLKANIGLTILVVLLSGYALYEGTRVPRLKELTLYSDKIQTPLKIAVLPDIHIHQALSFDKLKTIVDLTNAQHPDVIALPGDIIDDRAEVIKDLVSLLSEFNAPLGTFVVDGNHEIYVGTQMAQQEFQSAQITYLANEYRDIRPDVRIAGVPDIQSNRFGRPVQMDKALPDTSPFTVLLAHSPKMFDMKNNTADLQLSGHTHGGQIFPFHILAKISNTYLAGLYKQGNRQLYVSRGAGQWGPQMRLFAPSEITIITILPTKN